MHSSSLKFNCVPVLPTIFAGLLLACGLIGDVRGDVIELTTGHKIQGDVLKEQAGELYVDIGIDIVRVPLEKVKSRSKTEVEETATAPVDEKGIYLTARLPKKSVEALTEEFGEGVVLIQTPSGLGSGFIINKRGYCVTNYHVIERETRIAVTIFQKSEEGEFVRRRIDDVQIVAMNPFFDLALLQIPAQEDLPFRPVYIAEDADLREGDDVFAIGNPLGLERSVSKGIISTRNRNFEGVVYIQTTTQINPGNSGGPLFNSRGEVIGVTNMKLIFGEGLGFAIPMFYLKHFLTNRDAFAFDKNNDNSGFRYLPAPKRRNPNPPPAETPAP
ncbi:MAG: S1C family serine protease [Planctomycetaceae bacterium]